MDQIATGTQAQEPPNPVPLMRLALAYRSSMVLFAAVNLDLFTILADGAKTAEEVARACEGRLEPTRLLLAACRTEGLVTEQDRRYANTPLADAFLVRGRPAYSAYGLKYAEDLYSAWGALSDFVRSGRPPSAHDVILGDDKEKTRAFVYAMHERAHGIGTVLPFLDLTGRHRLLDVGGGPATYSLGLIQKTPGLTSTVLDLPGILEVTRELVAAHECGDRVTLLPGNYLTSSFGTGYDAVFLSGMMHRESSASCQLLLRKALSALDPGGVVIVSDVFFDDDEKTGPPFAVYFALNMMLTSDHGSAHGRSEMASWLKSAGFINVEIRTPNHHTLIQGTKP